MICTLCNRHEAIFHRLYSGEKLCEKCFSESIVKRVRKTISKYGMLRRDDRIAVAVSGGKDSTSLLHVLYEIEKDFSKAELFVLTVDEGIEDYRDEALKIVEKNREKLSIEWEKVSFSELYGLTLDEIAEKTMNEKGELTPCSFCGVLRRKALNKASKNFKATKLIVGHNLDDEVQTMLLNVVHGDVFRISR
ncbi:MAG: tRNA 2-thiocytidine biosynthesis TtcA family protein, partial [Candidatus Bathyarchaeota archaeon]